MSPLSDPRSDEQRGNVSVDAQSAQGDPEGSSRAQLDEWRDVLAAALEERFGYAVSYATVEIDWDEEADALLPTVRRIVAGELREMADEEFRNGSSLASFRLNDRADVLDSTDHGKA